MPTKIEIFNASYAKKEIPEVRPGDTVQVHQKIKDGDKERIQIFEGLVLARKHGKGISSTITVRKVSQGVGIERIFPLHSPLIDKIEIIKSAKVRKAKLYYLRTAKGKKAKLKARELGIETPEPVVAEPPEENTQETPEAPQEIQENK